MAVNYFRTTIIILIVLLLVYLVYTLYNQNTQKDLEESNDMEMMENQMDSNDEMMDDNVENFTNQDENNDMDYYSVDKNYEEQRNESNFPKEQLNADDLLPKDNASLWAQSNPEGEGSLKDRNFLQSGYHIGINTVGQTLRNANQQLRSDPPCPQVKVSPWLQTTIEPDLGRKPMEIGGCN
jgi:hypothetical protein